MHQKIKRPFHKQEDDDLHKEEASQKKEKINESYNDKDDESKNKLSSRLSINLRDIKQRFNQDSSFSNASVSSFSGFNFKKTSESKFKNNSKDKLNSILNQKDAINLVDEP